jgi:hypothetical protein
MEHSQKQIRKIDFYLNKRIPNYFFVESVVFFVESIVILVLSVPILVLSVFTTVVESVVVLELDPPLQAAKRPRDKINNNFFILIG